MGLFLTILWSAGFLYWCFESADSGQGNGVADDDQDDSGNSEDIPHKPFKVSRKAKGDDGEEDGYVSGSIRSDPA